MPGANSSKWCRSVKNTDLRVRKKHRSKNTNPKGLAGEALDYIGKLYQIEKETRARKLEPVPISELLTWVDFRCNIRGLEDQFQ